MNTNINSLPQKKQLDPISAPKKINTNILASSIHRKTSAKSEKVSINCEESNDIQNITDRKTQVDKTKGNNKNKNKNKPVKKTINLSKSLGSFNLFNNDNIPDEEGSIELDLNSAIEKQKAEKYKPLKDFLSEVKMPDLFSIFAKENIFTSERIENLCDYDMNKKKEKDIIFKKLNLNIKLGEKNLDKEIIIDIDNNNLSLLVNDILKENNLDENYFEPLLNIIEKSVDILINFDKINPSKYAIKNLEENKNILEENNNDIDDSLILDLIDNKNYKEYCDDALSDINFIKMKKERKR